MAHLKSMTAYSQVTHLYALGRFTLEVQSVNRKHLEIQLFLPQELQRFDSEIRRRLQQDISRGQITLRLFARFTSDTPIEVTANLPYARQLKSAFQAISDELDIPFDPSSFWQIAGSDRNLFSEAKSDHLDWDLIWKSLSDALDLALKQLLAMKELEGKELEKDILQRLGRIEKYAEEIHLKSPDTVQKLKQKLMLKIEEFLTASSDVEERLMREIALYAEKVDITEELIRLNSHLKQFRSLVDQGGPSSKTLEFLLQELNREVNTIGSKAQDANIAHLVVAAKGEIEKIREQIQNLE